MEMNIDIITYTPEQYAALSPEQLQEVITAQQRKNRLTRKLETDKKKEKQRLVSNGIYVSGMWEKIEAKLVAVYEEEIEFLRSGLLFYLHYGSKPSTGTTEQSPYLVDYSLSEVERYKIVRDYYEATYPVGSTRFLEFQKDTVAVQYLGELYKTLYDYFLSSV